MKKKKNIAVFLLRMVKIFTLLKKNRKAETWTLTEIVILFFAAFIVIATFGFFNELEAAVFSQKDDGSIANFDRLYSKIKELMENSEPLGYKTINYFIGNDKILVGFDTEWDDSKKVDSKGLDSNIYKPYKCGNAACLCLYLSKTPEDPAKRDEDILSCRSDVFAGKNIVFLSEGSEITPKTKGKPREDGKGNYLIFYGNDFRTQPIYIEKNYVREENKYYVYISKIDENNNNDPVNIRKTRIIMSIIDRSIR